MNFNRRKDYNQVMTVQQNSFVELKFAMHKIFAEQESMIRQRNNQIIESGKITWLFSRIQLKFDELCLLFINIT